jgi:hypothetical protein
LEVLDADRRPIPGLFAAGLTAGGTNGEGVFNATVLSNLGLAFSTGWIAGDNASVLRPSPAPDGMILESEVWQQQMLNELSRRFPRIGAAALRAGFELTSLRRKVAQRMAQHQQQT